MNLLPSQKNKSQKLVGDNLPSWFYTKAEIVFLSVKKKKDFKSPQDLPYLLEWQIDKLYHKKYLIEQVNFFS